MENDLFTTYVAIDGESSRLDKEMERVKKSTLGSAKQISKGIKQEMDVSNKSVKELIAMRTQLQKKFNERIKLNLDSKSIKETRDQLNTVNKALQGVPTASSKVSAGWGTLIGIGLVVAGVLKQISSAVKAYIEDARAIALVNQAIERTGGTAGLSTKEVAKMASELQKFLGIADDVILTDVTNQLLTFSNISGDTFKRAQKAVLDLNAVINKGDQGALVSQSIQLGKALNDPMKGMVALTRVGISFNEEQRKQIASFIKQNDLLSAQNLILTEVERQYGGQAKILADSSLGAKQLAMAWGDLLEQFGGFLANAPGVLKFINLISRGLETWKKVFDGIAPWNSHLKTMEESLSDISAVTKNLTLEKLKGSTKELRDETKKWNEEQIEENKRIWHEKEKQISLESASVRWNDNKIKQLQEEQKLISFNSAESRAEIEAIGLYEDKLKKVNEKWSLQGKSMIEIQDRIDSLTESVGFLVPKTDDSKILAIKKEIASLTKMLNYDDEEGNKILDNKIRKIAIENELRSLTSGLNIQMLEASKLTLQNLLNTVKTDESRLKILKEIKSITDEISNAKAKEIVRTIDVEAKGLDFPKGDLRSKEKIKSDLEDRKKVEEEIANLRISAMNDEFAQREEMIKLEYETQLQNYNDLLSEKLISETEYNEAIGNLQKIKESEIANISRQKFESGISAVRNIASVLHNAFGDNTLVNQLTKALEIAEAIATVIKSISIIGSLFGGGVSEALPAGREGGVFSKGISSTYNKLPKFSGGADFTVPKGYPKDSFLMRVQEDEKVNVIPSGRAGETDRLLGILIGRVGAVSTAISSLDLSVDITNNAPDIESQVKRNEKVKNRLNVSGVKFETIY